MNDTAALIAAMHTKGVSIWSENGTIRYRCRLGTLASEEIEMLRNHKAEILRLLDSSLAAGPAQSQILPRPIQEPIPLTFRQQWSWRQLQRLGMKYNARYCANATRLSGALDIECLKLSFAELVKRHEILRVRIVAAEDGSLTQAIAENRRLELDIRNLDQHPASDREAEAQRLIEEIVNQQCNVATDPLFLARLVRIDERDHVLAVALDHIIADALSVGIVLRDVWLMYLQATRGLSPSLPKVQLQYTDFAAWEQRTNAAWVAEHGQYWKERLAGAVQTHICSRKPHEPGARIQYAKTSVRLSKELTEELRKFGKEQRTTLVMTVLTAYVALLFRWTDATDLTLAFMCAGRDRPEFNNTVGFFSFVLYLRFDVHPNDNFKSLVRKVTKEYYTALKHQDCGRSGLTYPEPEYARTTAFNWQSRILVPAHALSGMSADNHTANGGAISVRSFPFKRKITDIAWDDDWNNYRDSMDTEPGIVLQESTEGISGEICYRVSAVAPKIMEDFARSLRLIAEAGCRDPLVSVTDLPCEGIKSRRE
jgi:Condensation domain/TubC N-terminal docking domain